MPKLNKPELIKLVTQYSSDMISEQFEYRGFTFQRMTKDGKWYVCYGNEIVNWGTYQNDLKEWVDGHFKK